MSCKLYTHVQRKKYINVLSRGGPTMGMDILRKITQLLTMIAGQMNFNEYHKVHLNDRFMFFLPFTSQVWVSQQ